MDYVAIETPSGRIYSTLSLVDWGRYVEKQAGNLFPDGFAMQMDALLPAIANSLAAIARCFRWVAISSYRQDGVAVLSHMHGDQYATFLAILARQLSSDAETELATRVYLLNKALHGLDLFHETALPEVFLLVHPVGTVIGRASLGNFLCVYQNCTIGGSPRQGVLQYPTLGNGVLMYSRTSIIGSSEVGNSVIMGAGSMLINRSVTSNALVVGDRVIVDAASVRPLLSRLFIGWGQ